MIYFNNVYYKYPNKNKFAINNNTFTINDGEFISILGNSGGGKSTLVKLIYGILTPTAGEMYSSYSNISYMPQDGNLLPYLSIMDNAKLHCKVTKHKFDIDKFDELARTLDILELVYRYPRDLSGGQRQRASLLNALIIDAECLILDESFSALDPITRHNMQGLMLKLHAQMPSLTILMITHDVDEAITLSDRILYINEGSILQFGTPTELVLEPATEEVNTFINKDNLTCDILINSWRISAIKRAQAMNRSYIDIIDDDLNYLFTLRVSDIEKSMKEHPGNTFDLKKVFETYGGVDK